MLSFWERDSFIKYDIIIIGAGITGLSTAASLKEKNPKLSILVLEKGLLPTGASTKNAGFACFGSLTEILSDLEVMSDEELLALVKMRWQGLAKTRNRLGDNTIDYQNNGGYELLFEDHPALEKLSVINDKLAELFEEPVYEIASEKINQFKFGKAKHLIFNKYEGQLHTGKLIKSLWNYCNSIGISIITGCEVTSVEQNENGVDILTEKIIFKGKKVAICTNAFTNKLLKSTKQINPGRGLVMAIKPRTTPSFKGTFHYDEGYYYFRNYNDHIIFGGGRNIDKDTENTTEFEINEKIHKKLIYDLSEIIIPDQTYKITDTWTGIMAFGETKEPLIEKVDDHVYIGVRLGGMGVAIGSQVGEALALQIIESSF